jgi:uncharacterized protein (DUF305 family)
MSLRAKPLLAAAVLVLALAAGLVVVAGDDSSATGNSIDTAFVTDMIPHHRDAVAMARVARDRAERPEIRAMAREIMSTQHGEIAVLERIGDDLHHMGMRGGHMGMSADSMGMSGGMPMSRDGRAFDRAFLEAMIAHHRGAVRMAHRQLTEGEHPGLSHMSRGMIAAQSRELRQMESWHERWYGGQ